MCEINSTTLIDRLLDVDPDLRFMALQDLNQHLTLMRDETANSEIRVSFMFLKTLIPHILRLLEDQNTDVQSQAVKIFAPIVPYLPLDALLSVIGALYALIMKETSKSSSVYKSFTTTVPYVALKTLITASRKPSINQTQISKGGCVACKDAPISRSTAKAIVHKLVPMILASKTITIDSIELLYDVVFNFGDTLDQGEVKLIGEHTLNAAFKESGIVGKRSIATFAQVCQHVTSSELLGKFWNSIVALETTRPRHETIHVSCQLYSSLVNQPCGLPSVVLELLIAVLTADLKLTGGSHNLVDFDYDNLVEENYMRDHALGVVNAILVSMKHNNLARFKSLFLDIATTFVDFDPLGSLTKSSQGQDGGDNDSDIDFDDNDDDIAFTDDENGLDASENDGLWKLRAKASCLVRLLLGIWPELLPTINDSIIQRLPLTDSNELVSVEAINTLSQILRASQYADASAIALCKDVVMQIFVLDKKSSPSIDVLSIVSSIAKFGDASFVDDFLEKKNATSRTTASSLWPLPHVLSFYSGLLASPSLDLNERSANYILADISLALCDSGYTFVSQGLGLLLDLLPHPWSNKLEPAAISQVTKDVILIIKNHKRYSTVIGTSSIQVLGCILSRFGNVDESAYTALCDGLIVESLSKSALRALILLLNKSIGVEQICRHSLLLDCMPKFIISADADMQVLSLSLLSSMVEQLPISYGLDYGFSSLTSILKSGDTSAAVPIALGIFSSLLSSATQICNRNEELLAAVIELANRDTLQDNNRIQLMQLIQTMVGQRPGLFEAVGGQLSSTSETSAHVLAVMCVATSLTHEIESRENALVSISKEKTIHDADGISLLQNVRFLGYVGATSQLRNLSLEHLVPLLHMVSLKISLQTQEAAASATTATSMTPTTVTTQAWTGLALAIAKSMGLIASRDPSSHLGYIIAAYSSPENSAIRRFLVTLFKPIIQLLEKSDSELVWLQVWQTVSDVDFNPADLMELKNSAEILSGLALRDHSLIERVIDFGSKLCKPSEYEGCTAIYTGAVAIKELIKHIDDENATIELMSRLMALSCARLDIGNVEVRQITIGNLLTALNVRRLFVFPILKDYVLPGIFAQLKPVPAFQRVIPMGPYKYVIDEGIEVRKLSYEFLHTLVAMEIGVAAPFVDLPMTEIARQVVENGLEESLPDVFVLATISLVNIIARHAASFEKLLLIDDGIALKAIMDKLTAQLKKKLSDKASAHETEAHNERIRVIVNLSKSVDAVVVNLMETLCPAAKKDWAAYMSTIAVEYKLVLHSS